MNLTEDNFLNGRVSIRQPERGFRAGLDAVLVAAAVPACAGEDVLELGAGVGTASLCLATRVKGCAVTSIEINEALCKLANDNAAINGAAGRVSFRYGNALDLPRDLRRSFAHVFCNPPFHYESSEASPHEMRRQALQDGENALPLWLRAGLKRTEDGGTFTVILRADRLAEALTALHSGGMAIYPLWQREGEPAKRVIVQKRKSSAAPLRLCAGLILHRADGGYTEQADAILRDGVALPW